MAPKSKKARKKWVQARRALRRTERAEARRDRRQAYLGDRSRRKVKAK